MYAECTFPLAIYAIWTCATLARADLTIAIVTRNAGFSNLENISENPKAFDWGKTLEKYAHM